MTGRNQIQVGIKVRPLLHPKEKDLIWRVVDNSIQLMDTQSEYYFDHIFDQNATNQIVFDKMAKQIVQSAVEGFNGTIFAYGQTSSGKTYTMMGDKENPGVMVLTVKEIFKQISTHAHRKFLLRVGYIEIYNEKINDLLNKANQDLKIHETNMGIISVNCEEVIVTSEESMLLYLEQGGKERTVGETNMNERSSRSHAIFRIIIESRKIEPGAEDCITQSILNLVDLAGSERADQTKARGARLKEGGHINKSLLFLSNVIKRLSENEDDKYISYRDSKLTRILQASLGGNALTAIICTIKPNAIEETQSTLSFAMRAKTIKNKPQLNEIVSDATMMKRLEKEIESLKSKLAEEKHKNESKRKVGELEQRIKNELLKIISCNSLETLRKQNEKRRRTWASSDTTNDGNVPLPSGIPRLAQVPSSSKTKISSLAIHYNTPLVTQRTLEKWDSGVKCIALAPHVEEFKKELDICLCKEEDYVPTEMVNLENKIDTSPQHVVKIMVDPSTPYSYADPKTALEIAERNLNELQMFTNLEQNNDVMHDVNSALQHKVNCLTQRNKELENEYLKYIQMKIEYEELLESNKNFRRQHEELENQCSDLKMRIRELTDTNDAAEKTIKYYKNELMEIKETCEKLKIDNRNFINLDFRYESLQNKTKIREAELLDRIKDKDLEIAALENTLKSSRKHNEEQLKEIAFTHTLTLSNQQLQQTLQEEISQLKLKLAEAVQKEETQQRKLCEMENEICINKADALNEAISNDAKYKELQTQFDELQKEYDVLSLSNQRIQQTLQEEISQLKLKLAEAAQKEKAQQQQLCEMENEICINKADLLNGATSNDAKYKELQTQFDELQKEYDVLSLSNQRIQQTLQEEISQLKLKLAEAVQKEETLQRKLCEMESEICINKADALNEAISNDAKYKELQTQFDELQKEYDVLSLSNQQLQQTLQEEISQLKLKLAEAVQKEETQQRKLCEMENEICINKADALNEATSNDAKYKELQTQFDELQKEYDVLSLSNQRIQKTLQEEISQLKLKLAEAVQKEETQQRKLCEVESEICINKAGALNEATSNDAKYKELQTQFAELQKEYDVLSLSNQRIQQTLQEEISQLKLKLAEAVQKEETLQRKLCEMESEICINKAGALNEATSNDAKYKELQTQFDELQKEYDVLSLSNQQLQQTLQEEISQLKLKLAEAVQKEETQQRKLYEMENEICINKADLLNGATSNDAKYKELQTQFDELQKEYDVLSLSNQQLQQTLQEEILQLKLKLAEAAQKEKAQQQQLCEMENEICINKADALNEAISNDAKYKELQTQFDELQKEYDVLSLSNQQLQQTLQEEVLQLKLKLAEAAQKEKAQQQQLCEMENEICINKADLLNGATSNDAKYKELQTQFDELQKEYDVLSLSNQRIQQTLQEEISQLKLKLAEAVQKEETQQRKLCEMENEICINKADALNDATCNDAKYKELQTQFAELQKEYDVLSLSNQRIQQTLQEEISQLKLKLAEAAQKEKAQQQQLCEMENEICINKADLLNGATSNDAKYKELQTQFDELQKEYDVLSLSNQRIQQTLQEEILQLKLKVAEAAQKEKAQQRKLCEMESEICINKADALNEATCNDAKYKELQTQFAELQKEYDVLSLSNQRIQQTLQEEISQLKLKLAEAVQKEETQQRKLCEMENEICINKADALNEAISNDAKYKELQTQFDELQKEYDVLSLSNQQLQQTLQEEISQLKLKLAEAVQKEETLQRKLCEMESEICINKADALNEATSNDAKYKELQTQFDELQKEYDVLSLSNQRIQQTLQEEISQLKLKLAEAVQKEETLQRKLCEMESEICINKADALNEAISNDAKYKELQTQFDELQKEYDVLSLSNQQLQQTLQEEISQLKLKLAEAVQKEETLQRKLCEMESEICINKVDALNEATSNDAKYKELQTQFDELQKEYDVLSNQLIDNLQDNENLKKENYILTQHVKSFQVGKDLSNIERERSENVPLVQSQFKELEANEENVNMSLPLKQFLDLSESFNQIELIFANGNTNVFKLVEKKNTISTEMNLKLKINVHFNETDLQPKLTLSKRYKKDLNNALGVYSDDMNTLLLEGILITFINVIKLGQKEEVNAGCNKHTDAMEAQHSQQQQKIIELKELLEQEKYANKLLLENAERNITELREQINRLTAELLEKSLVVENCSCVSNQKNAKTDATSDTFSKCIDDINPENTVNNNSHNLSESVILREHEMQGIIEDQHNMIENLTHRLVDVEAQLERCQDQLQSMQHKERDLCSEVQIEKELNRKINEEIKKFKEEWCTSKKFYENNISELRNNLEFEKQLNLSCDENSKKIQEEWNTDKKGYEKSIAEIRDILEIEKQQSLKFNEYLKDCKEEWNKCKESYENKLTEMKQKLECEKQENLKYNENLKKSVEEWNKCKECYESSLAELREMLDHERQINLKLDDNYRINQVEWNKQKESYKDSIKDLVLNLERLQERLSQKETENSTNKKLFEDFINLQDINRALQNELSKYQHECKKLTSDIEELRTCENTLKNENTRLHQDIEILQKVIEKMETESKKLLFDMAQLEKKYQNESKKLANDNKELKQCENALRVENKRIQDDFEVSQKKVQQILEEKNKLQIEAAELKKKYQEECKRLGNDLKEYENMLKKEKKRYQDVLEISQKQILQIIEEKKIFEVDMRELEKKYKEECKVLANDINELKESEYKLKNENKRFQEDIAISQKQMLQILEEKEKLEINLGDLEKKCQENCKRLTNHMKETRERESMSQENTRLQDDILIYQKKVQQIMEEKKNLQIDMEELKQTDKAGVNELGNPCNLEEKLKNVIEENLYIKAEKSKFLDNIEAQEAQLSYAAIQIKDLESYIKQLKNENEQCKVELSQLKCNLNENQITQLSKEHQPCEHLLNSLEIKAEDCKSLIEQQSWEKNQLYQYLNQVFTEKECNLQDLQQWKEKCKKLNDDVVEKSKFISELKYATDNHNTKKETREKIIKELKCTQNTNEVKKMCLSDQLKEYQTFSKKENGVLRAQELQSELELLKMENSTLKQIVEKYVQERAAHKENLKLYNELETIDGTCGKFSPYDKLLTDNDELKATLTNTQHSVSHLKSNEINTDLLKLQLLESEVPHHRDCEHNVNRELKQVEDVYQNLKCVSVKSVKNNHLQQNDTDKLSNNQLHESKLGSIQQKGSSERRLRRLSTHDERRRQSFYLTSDKETMTISLDSICQCQELDKKLQECRQQLLIRDSQVTWLNMQLKNHPLKEENATLSKRLHDEQREVIRITQQLNEEIIKSQKALAAYSKIKETLNKRQDGEQKHPQEQSVNSFDQVIPKIVTDAEAQTYSELNEEFHRLQLKNNDLQKLCRYRYKTILKLEEQIKQIEGQKDNTDIGNHNDPLPPIQAAQFSILKNSHDTMANELKIVKEKYEKAKVALQERRDEVRELRGQVEAFTRNATTSSSGNDKKLKSPLKAEKINLPINNYDTLTNELRMVREKYEKAKVALQARHAEVRQLRTQMETLTIKTTTES